MIAATSGPSPASDLSRIATMVAILPNERRTTLSAFVSLFGITAAHTLIETARDAVFLAKLPPSRLPWMYLGIAALGVLLARATRTQGRASPILVPASILGAAALTAGF